MPRSLPAAGPVASSVTSPPSALMPMRSPASAVTQLSVAVVTENCGGQGALGTVIFMCV